MRKQQETLIRPYVSISVFLRVGTPLFQLHIKNIGKTAACQLNLSIDKDFYQLGEKSEERNLAKHIAFTQTIDSLPPEGELIFLIANGLTLYTEEMQDLCPKVFTVSASYLVSSQTVTERTNIDLRPYIGTSFPQDYVAEELKQITKAIKDGTKTN